MCVWVIKEQGSHSGFARFVGRPFSTPKPGTMSLWALRWARLPTLTFRRRDFPFMRAAGIHGFSCHQARKHSTKIPLDCISSPIPYRVQLSCATSKETIREDGHVDCCWYWDRNCNRGGARSDCVRCRVWGGLRHRDWCRLESQAPLEVGRLAFAGSGREERVELRDVMLVRAAKDERQATIRRASSR
jgi:hypothetical protein